MSFVKITDFIFFFFASFKAFSTFLLLQDVDIPIAISPVFPIDSSCLEKISLNEKSLPIAVRDDVSVDKEIAGIDLLFFLYFTTNSAAICWASEALPPFPNKIILFPFFNVLIINSINYLKIPTSLLKNISAERIWFFTSNSNILFIFNFFISKL